MRELDITNSRFPIKNATDCARRHSKAPGNQVAFHFALEGSDFGNLFAGESSVPNVSAFFDHVSNIVGIRAEKEMSGANAVGTIAGMKHPQIIGDRSEMDHPREPVGEFVPSIGGSCNSSVSFRKFAGPEQPAAIALNNSMPEPVDNGWRKTLSDKIREITVDLHTTILSVELVCRSLARKSARTFSFLPQTS